MSFRYASALGHVMSAKSLGSLQERKKNKERRIVPSNRKFSDDQVRLVREDLKIMTRKHVAEKWNVKLEVINALDSGVSYSKVR